MRAAVLAAMALVLTVGAAARAEAAQQWACRGSATSEGGARVDLDLMVKADSKVVGVIVTWHPPQVRSGGLDKGDMEPAPDVMVVYIEDGRGAMGPPHYVTVWLAGDSSLASLDKLTVSLTMDEGGGRWQANMERLTPPGRDDVVMGFVSDVFGPDGSAIEPTIDRGGTAVVTVASPKGEILASGRFDFSAKGERDALFAMAWAHAAEKAKTPAQCGR